MFDGKGEKGRKCRWLCSLVRFGRSLWKKQEFCFKIEAIESTWRCRVWDAPMPENFRMIDDGQFGVEVSRDAFKGFIGKYLSRKLAKFPSHPELILSRRPFRVKLNIFALSLRDLVSMQKKNFMNKFYNWKFQLKGIWESCCCCARGQERKCSWMWG